MNPPFVGLMRFFDCYCTLSVFIHLQWGGAAPDRPHAPHFYTAQRTINTPPNQPQKSTFRMSKSTGFIYIKTANNHDIARVEKIQQFKIPDWEASRPAVLTLPPDPAQERLKAGWRPQARCSLLTPGQEGKMCFICHVLLLHCWSVILKDLFVSNKLILRGSVTVCVCIDSHVEQTDDILCTSTSYIWYVLWCKTSHQDVHSNCIWPVTNVRDATNLNNKTAKNSQEEQYIYSSFEGEV